DEDVNYTGWPCSFHTPPPKGWREDPLRVPSRKTVDLRRKYPTFRKPDRRYWFFSSILFFGLRGWEESRGSCRKARGARDHSFPRPRRGSLSPFSVSDKEPE